MEPLTLQTIADYARGSLRQGVPSRLVSGISSDSRAVQPNELFLALSGDRFDGHQFVAQVAADGALGAVVAANKERGALPAGFALLEVTDPLESYQRIAGCYRCTLPCRVVAITGSNGKTSTKDFTAAVLGNRYRVLKTSGNLNNHIGVPRTLLQLGPQDEVAVVEMGMNHPGEIAPLAHMAAPDVAVITNIGTAHIEYMGTQAAIAQEKGTLAEAIGPQGHVVLLAEDPFAAGIARRTRAQVVTVGFERGNIRAQDLQPGPTGTVFTVVDGDQHQEIRLPVPGRHMVLNALLAVAVGRTCGVSLAEAARGLEGANLTKGRLELKQVGALRFLDDSYNANPDSMVAALETLARMPVAGRRIAVLGRMGELGDHAATGNHRVGVAAAREHIDQVLVVGADAAHLVEGARSAGLQAAAVLSSVEEVGQWLSRHAQPEDLILLKGSRSAGMERVLAQLAPDAAAAV